MKSAKRIKAMAAKRARKAQSMKDANSKSNYRRKRDYLAKHGLWGFECVNKPWKAAA